MLKKIIAAISPRADAVDALAKYHELADAEKTKQEEYKSYASSQPVDLRTSSKDRRPTEHTFRTAVLGREWIEVADASSRAAFAAAQFLDAAEVAEGDAVALARDPKHLRDDLVALAAERTALLDQIKEIERRTDERRAQAFKADAELAARRQAAGAPMSVPLPPFVPWVPVGCPTFMQLLHERAEKGASAPSKAQEIENARADEQRIASQLEAQEREKEQHEREKELDRKARQAAEEEARRRDHARAAETRAAAEAEASRQREFADAWRSRQSGGAS